MTRIGGEDCPAVKYLRWHAGIFEINSDVANRMHELLCQRIDEIRDDSNREEFSARRAAARILTQAAEAVNELNDGVLNPKDVEALTALKLAVDTAFHHAVRAGAAK